jgi:type IV pilus assembly protein PilC
MATATFEYKVRDRAGHMKTGTLDAESSTQVAAKLKNMGYAPISITQANAGMNKELAIPGFGKKRVKLKDLAVFSRQFSVMINSGLSLLRALTILTEQTENKELARVLGEVRNDIESGGSLSSALAKFPDAFPPLMINMCRAGEVGGFLDGVLVSLAENFEAEVKLRGKVKSAMTYPIVVFCIAVIAVIGMLLFIVPVFASLFKGLGGTLPLPTQILVYLSGMLKTLGPLLLVLVIAANVVWRKVKRRPQVRAVVDPMKLKLPVFGNLFQKIAISRFTRNLGTMLRAGVPILQSLEIVGSTAGNVVIERAATDVMESVRKGESLAGPLTEHWVFPAMVVQMISVGEDTGALDEMLHKISDFYDQDVEATTESLTALIEPLMIAFMGGIIGSMIVALYMPIFKIFDLIK